MDEPAYDPNYPAQEALARVGGAKLARAMTEREQLVYQKKTLEAQLARVNKAIELLDAHPEIEQVMTAVSQALYGRI